MMLLRIKKKYLGKYNSIGRVIVCGSIGSWFESKYLPL